MWFKKKIIELGLDWFMELLQTKHEKVGDFLFSDKIAKIIKTIGERYNGLKAMYDKKDAEK